MVFSKDVEDATAMYFMERGISRLNKDEAFGHFIAGFVAGEGCFMVTAHQKTKLKLGFHLSPIFQVLLNKRDKDLLIKIRDFIGCGKVYLPHPKCVYSVSSRQELAEIIIPFFEKYPLHGDKKRNFEIWREIVELLEKERNHLSSDTFFKCVRLRERLNNSQRKKRYTFKNITEKVNKIKNVKNFGEINNEI